MPSVKTYLISKFARNILFVGLRPYKTYVAPNVHLPSRASLGSPLTIGFVDVIMMIEH